MAMNHPLRSNGTADSNRHFETGAVRDTNRGKPRPDLISGFFELRLGEWLRVGAAPKSEGGKGYGDRNWEKGMPLSAFLESASRHFAKAKAGMTDEDHWAALAFNIMGIIHGQGMIHRGVWPKHLDDLPRYGPIIEDDELEDPDGVDQFMDLTGGGKRARHGNADRPAPAGP